MRYATSSSLPKGSQKLDSGQKIYCNDLQDESEIPSCVKNRVEVKEQEQKSGEY